MQKSADGIVGRNPEGLNVDKVSHTMEMNYTDQKFPRGEANIETTGGIPEESEKAVTDNSTSNGHANRQASTLFEEILSRENMMKAYKAVKRNQGAPGVDGMRVSEVSSYLKKNWSHIKHELLTGKYKPKPVRRIGLRKGEGGIRKLGIPTVMDRLIQQAILQQLQPSTDPTFSEHSYGFRPGLGTHEAVKALKKKVEKGYEYVVDIDLEKFFDTVQHDRLMTKLKSRIADQRVLTLIRKYLKAGVFENGVVIDSTSGVPQGSPLSPLLSNIILDELDKELEKRGHQFIRYADDCNILVKSLRSGKRVLKSLTKFIETRLKLRINQEKSAVSEVGRRKFLGYTCSKWHDKIRLFISKSSVTRFKGKVRELTKIRGGVSFKQLLAGLKPLIIGWANYFKLSESIRLLKNLDGWIRRRLRACAYSLMKTGKKRLSYFIKAGISYDRAYKCAYSSRGIWHASRGDVMQQALSNNHLKRLGLVSLAS